jgi:hypothetical protein
VTLPETIKSLGLAAAVSLLCAAPALAVPAGDEYLPQVPTATGDKPVNESGDAGGSSGGEKATSDKDKKDPDAENDSETESGALAAGSGDDGDDSGGGVLDTLLDPIVLLVIGGVLTIAVGLMLARKQNGDSPDPSRARRSSSDAPPPPDGEIVGGSERS